MKQPKLYTQYDVVCLTPKKNTRWKIRFRNLVTDAGLNKVLDATFKTGIASPAWYLGLKFAGTYLAADTMSSHPGWSESTDYSNVSRPLVVLGTIVGGSVNNSGTRAQFNINNNVTIAGVFMVDNNTIGGTSGTLYGVGDFSAPRAVSAGDTLMLTVTLGQN